MFRSADTRRAAGRLPARVAVGAVSFLLASCGGENGLDAKAAAGAASGAPVVADGPDPGQAGDGFVVWESNRSRAWRIWTVDLAAGSTPWQLTVDEEGRDHCCPHLSPDGRRMVYLSLPPGGAAYRAEASTGPLHLLDLATGEDRVVAPRARTYFENRAAVWRDSDELIFIDGEGRSALLDLETGDSSLLTTAVEESHGWLVSPDLGHATRGRPAFSPYDESTRTVAPRAELGGCQPYFSADGRWGYWVAGAGGPINRIDLTGGEVSTILRKSDPRLVEGYGYLYFPMFSADGRAFTFAASQGQHSHLEADYEVFVVAADPSTLTLAGSVRRITRHPATDRFPDVFLAPQALGSHDGEVPFEVELRPPTVGDDWSWSFGDGDDARGAVGRHVYREAGRYRVEARSRDRVLTGTVTVRPARAPRAVAAVAIEGGRSVRIRFDEPVIAEAPTLVLASGIETTSWRLSADQREVVVALGRSLERFDRLEVGGFRDLASRPNLMEPAALEVEPPLWPARRDGLVFLWRSGDSPNLFFDRAAGADRAGLLEPSGRAFLDGRHRMRLAGGVFSASEEESNRLRWALQATNEMTIELDLEPAPEVAGEPRATGEAALVSFGGRGQPHNFALLQRGRELVFSLRVASRGPGLHREVSLGSLPPGRRHLALSYTPGRLSLDLDGERVVDSDAIQGDFFHWRSLRLTLGGRWGGGQEWRGALAGLALYDRALSADEARENDLRYRRLRARSESPPEVVVEARLTRRSPVPTLEEIRPYREALAVYEYEIERVVSGEAPSGPLTVAHWVLLDGVRQAEGSLQEGRRLTLRLEPFAEQPQLTSLFLSNRLGSPPAFFSPDAPR